jgi:DNA-binding IclR family transcriptional regulator
MNSSARPRSSLTSGLDILELLEETPYPLHLSEIADGLQMSRSGTHKTLKALSQRGLVQRTRTLAYHLAQKSTARKGEQDNG